MSRIEVRAALPADAESILRAHFSAVHETAARDYPSAIVEEWSTPVTETRIKNYIEKALPNETTLVALVDGQIAGFGAIVERINELRAVYVAAAFGGLGVGSALLAALERLAIEGGCPELRMSSSVTAAAFYAKHGYEELERGIHTLSSGSQMACVKMRKSLGV